MEKEQKEKPELRFRFELAKHLRQFSSVSDSEYEAKVRKEESERQEKAFASACGSEKFCGVELSDIGELQDVTVGKGKKATRRILEDYIADVSCGKMRFLWLCGSPGTGKTTLSLAVMHELCRKDVSCAYYKSHKIMQRLRDAEKFSSKTNPAEILSEINCKQFCVIDEIGRWPVPEWEKFRLFDIINDLYEGFRSAIFISNLHGQDLADFIGTAATDRFRGVGMILEFKGGSFRGAGNELYVGGGTK